MSERSFVTPQPLGVEIKVAAGTVHLRTVDGDQSTVTVDGPPNQVDAAVVELVGRRLIVEQRRTARWAFFDWGEGALHIEIKVPHGSTVELATASGDVRLEGTLAGLDAKSASGAVWALGEIAGDATISTASGETRLDRVAGDLNARTVSGGVQADLVEGSVSVKSVSGDIRVGSVREGRVTVHSVSGDVEVGVAPGTRVDVDAGSASGQISSELTLSDVPPPGDGPTVMIRSNTVSGDVRLVRAA
jgi:hypothetical protein